MEVLIDGGRTADLADYIAGDEIGIVADSIAADAYNGGAPIEGATFSFKADGLVLEPTVGAIPADTKVLELVDVTGGIHHPGDGIEVPLGETDALVDQHALADVVPDGTVDEVIAWVGDNAVRAQAAMTAEQSAEKPRKSLIAHLEPIAALSE